MHDISFLEKGSGADEMDQMHIATTLHAADVNLHHYQSRNNKINCQFTSIKQPFQ